MTGSAVIKKALPVNNQCFWLCKEMKAKSEIIVRSFKLYFIFCFLMILMMFYYQAHDDRISVLRLTESTIISASYDKTVKLWDRTTEKQVRYSLLIFCSFVFCQWPKWKDQNHAASANSQWTNKCVYPTCVPLLFVLLSVSLLLQVGMFVCGGPVLALEVNPEKPTELVCADGQGKLYFLSWKE